MGLKYDLPLVCPFCDEVAYPKRNSIRKALPNKIYTLRECIMGHQFYSVEEVPENQAEIVDEIREINADAIQWRKTLKDMEQS